VIAPLAFEGHHAVRPAYGIGPGRPAAIPSVPQIVEDLVYHAVQPSAASAWLTPVWRAMRSAMSGFFIPTTMYQPLPAPLRPQAPAKAVTH